MKSITPFRPTTTLRAIKLVCNKIATAIIEGRTGLEQVTAVMLDEPVEGGENRPVIELTEPLIFTPDEE